MRGENFDDTLQISDIEQGRRVFRRKQNIRSVFISCISFLAVLSAIVLVLSNSEGWEKVKFTYFNPEMFVRSFPQVAKGLLTNLQIFSVAIVVVSLTAVLLAVVRTTRSSVLFPLRVLAIGYTSIFRGVPLILMLYLVGFGIPALGIFGRIEGWILGVIAVSISYSAYVSEIIRAGLEAVHPSQRMAARALGFSYVRTVRSIILPQGVRKVIPALMNDLVALQKDVGLVSVIGITDVIRQAQKFNAVTFNYTPYVVAALLFICMSIPLILLTDWYSRKVQRREQMQGAV